MTVALPCSTASLPTIPELSMDEIELIAIHGDLQMLHNISCLCRLWQSVATEVIASGRYAQKSTPLAHSSEDEVDALHLHREPNFIAPVIGLGHNDGIVFSSPRSNILVLREAGGRTLEISTRGVGPGEIFCPTGVACDGFAIFIAEYGNHRVQKFRVDNGAPITLATGADGLGFLCPQGLALSSSASGPDGRLLFVADSHNRRVVALRAHDLSFVRSYKVNSPGVVAERNGTLVVSSPTTATILRVADGTVIGRVEYASDSAHTLPSGALRRYCVTMLQGGLIVVADSRANHLFVTSPRGEPWGVLTAAPGDTIGTLNATADGRRLLIADPRRQCVRSVAVDTLLADRCECAHPADSAVPLSGDGYRGTPTLVRSTSDGADAKSGWHKKSGHRCLLRAPAVSAVPWPMPQRWRLWTDKVIGHLMDGLYVA